MFTAADMLSKIAEGPFRVVTVSGITHDILHREMFMVTRQHLHIGVYEGRRREFPERVVTVYLPHVVELKSLPAHPPY